MGCRTRRLADVPIGPPSAPDTDGPEVEPRPAPADDLAAFVSRGIGTDVYRPRGRVTVHAPAVVVAGRFGPRIATVIPLDADSCEVTTGTNDLTEVVCWLGVIGAELTVHEPAVLRQVMADVSARLARSAGD
jgi:hypothetical protein